MDSLRKVVDCVLDVSSTGWTSSSSCEDSDLHLPIVVCTKPLLRVSLEMRSGSCILASI